MFRHGLRRFATAAAPVVADPSPYLLNLAKAQGTVKGLTGGMHDASDVTAGFLYLHC